MSDVPRSLQSWVSTIHTVVLTADVFQLFIKYSNTIIVNTFQNLVHTCPWYLSMVTEGIGYWYISSTTTSPRTFSGEMYTLVVRPRLRPCRWHCLTICSEATAPYVRTPSADHWYWCVPTYPPRLLLCLPRVIWHTCKAVPREGRVDSEQRYHIQHLHNH